MPDESGIGDWIIVRGHDAPDLQAEVLNEALAASPMEMADGGELMPGATR